MIFDFEMNSLKLNEGSRFSVCHIAYCQVEHIIVKPQLETAFIRLYPGAVVKGEKVGATFYSV